MKVLCTSQTGSSTALGQTMRVTAIAKALQRRGAEVKFLAGEKLIPVIQDYKIDIIPLPAMPEIDHFSDAGFMKDERYQQEIADKLKVSLKLSTDAEKEAIAVEKPDLMLCGSPLSALTAKTAGIPGVLTVLQPHGKKTLQYLTSRMPGLSGKPGQANSGNGLNSVMNIYAEIMAGKGIDDFLADAGEALGLILVEGMPEISGGIHFDQIKPDLGALADWLPKLAEKVRFTGPLLAEIPENIPSQADLKLRYIGNKDQLLIYVTIGGGTSLIGEEFLRLVLEMFRRLPAVKGVVSTGLAVSPEKLAGYDPPSNAVIHRFVPGMELIKASDVTVFHGGSSTLMTCIACGRPAAVVPSMAEQEDNGAVLSQNGAGVVLDKSNLTAEILAAAVQKILDQVSFRNQAQKLKSIGDKYGGAAGAAMMIEELLKEGSLVNAGAHFGSR